uniref:Suppressor APC domain-containing protein n=1 Tax=Glossina austeni TaxID=7395 RepID=A0A1A9V6A8_GLOAU
MNNLHNNSKLTNPSINGNALDALPKSFVVSMKTLFDILDDQLSGYVKFSDIEKGWQDDGNKGLPHGVLDSLRKVTPANGLLTFERFCAGLKLCLLRNQNQLKANDLKTTTTLTPINGVWKAKSPLKASRPPSAPSLAIENPIPNNPWSDNVKTNHISFSQRALSLPQLSPDSEGELATLPHTLRSPPKPPRASVTNTVNVNKTNALVSASTMDRNEIRHALQNWQLNILRNKMENKDKLSPANYLQQCGYRGSADGGSSSATDSGNFMNLPLKKSSSKRREPRRHTLQNGIDYNMLKRLKQYEEEREVLLLGLEAVNKAREWYTQQLINVQEKIKYLGRMGNNYTEQWSEVQEERLNFQRARVIEVNRSLSTLPDTWERGGFPLHFNLAIRSPTKSLNQRLNNGLAVNSVNDRLRQQNRLLTSEVHLKSEHIAMLEREKQTLLAELFDLKQRSGLTRHTNSYLNALSQSSPGCSSSSGGLGDADVVY